jgi:RNA recognition motif-containing protein
MRQVFGKFGRVGSIKFVADRTGQNEHSGSVFIKYREAEGLKKALLIEKDADRKLKELASVIKRSDKRDLSAVEGFGVSLRGRRLVLKQALAPGEVAEEVAGKKPEKGKAKEERSSGMHLLHVGEINENHEDWMKLSKSERRQRQASMKERKFRVNNSNFALHPLRLSVRNLPRHVDATKMREVLIGHLASQKFLDNVAGKQERRKKAQAMIKTVNIVRDAERRTDANERRSRGFGFMAFEDHRSATTALELLNDNPSVFGGGKRPIVEFAIEDKRKLRMQEELYARHAHKLTGATQQGKDADQAKGKDKGKEGKDADGASAEQRKTPTKSRAERKKEPEKMSRGQKQRERRRQQKAAKEEKGERREAFEVKMDQKRDVKRAQSAANREITRKRSKRLQPDAGASAKKSRFEKPGQMSDDFELRAMERFRTGRR